MFREPNPELHVVVSALTGGGVGPGDRLGNLDVDLLMRTCMNDGTLLKPTSPITATRAQLLKMAFGGR